jgi:esterase/lipase
MNPLLFLVFAANLALAADAAKPATTPATEPAAKATKRAAATPGIAQRQAIIPDEVEGVAKEELAKIKAAALKAFQDESVKGARERMTEIRGRLEFASGAERKDLAADARRAVDEMRSALLTAICKNDATIKMESLEKVMDAMDEKRTKVMENAKKKKAAEKAPATEDPAKKKTT